MTTSGHDQVPEGLDPRVERRDLRFEADVVSVTPFLKIADVSRNGEAHFTFVSDEGPQLGGLGSSPPPLAYFTAAIAF